VLYPSWEKFKSVAETQPHGCTGKTSWKKKNSPQNLTLTQEHLRFCDIEAQPSLVIYKTTNSFALLWQQKNAPQQMA